MTTTSVLDPDTDLSRAVVEGARWPMGRLNTYALACCLHEMLNRGILPPSIAAAQEVLEGDNVFVRKLDRLYPDEKETEQVLSLDTAERDWMLEILAQRFARCSWPCLGDPLEAHDAFVRSFAIGIKAVDWDWQISLPK